MTQTRLSRRRSARMLGAAALAAAAAAACAPYGHGGPWWEPRPHAARPADAHWHPVGAYISVLPAGHSTVVVAGVTYYYVDGVFFVRDGLRYRAVPAPRGAVIPAAPRRSSPVIVDQPYRYYFGTYYRPHDSGGFRVAPPPPPGAAVRYLPPGYKVRKIRGQRYYEYGGVTYRREQRDGVTVYVVVRL